MQFIASVYDVYGTMPHGLFLGVAKNPESLPEKWVMFVHGGVELGLDARGFLQQPNNIKTVVIGRHQVYKRRENKNNGAVEIVDTQVVKIIDRSFILRFLSVSSAALLRKKVERAVSCANKKIPPANALSADDILGPGDINRWTKETNGNFYSWPADDNIEYNDRIIPAHMALQLRWGDFSDHADELWSMENPGRQKLGSELTETWMREHGVATIFRGHQHYGTYLEGLLQGHGFYNSWGKESVLTIISGANLFGANQPQRFGDAFAILGVIGDAPATWTLTKCTRAPDLQGALARNTAPRPPKLDELKCFEDKSWNDQRKQSEEDNILFKKANKSKGKAEDEQQIDSRTCEKKRTESLEEEAELFARKIFKKPRPSSPRSQQNIIHKGLISQQQQVDPMQQQQQQLNIVIRPVDNQRPPADYADLKVVAEYCKIHPDVELGPFRCVLTWMQNGFKNADDSNPDGTFRLPGKAFLAAAFDIDKSNQSPRQGKNWWVHWSHNLRVFDSGKRTRHLALVVAEDVLKNNNFLNLAAGKTDSRLPAVSLAWFDPTTAKNARKAFDKEARIDYDNGQGGSKKYEKVFHGHKKTRPLFRNGDTFEFSGTHALKAQATTCTDFLSGNTNIKNQVNAGIKKKVKDSCGVAATASESPRDNRCFCFALRTAEDGTATNLNVMRVLFPTPEEGARFAAKVRV